jgi:hypothetical protein
MEVHHHSHHPKKWKEYITEFLMLFLAVSLGFMAENIREHQVEKQREIKFLQNIHQDLQKDIKEIDTNIAYMDQKQLLADTLFSKIKDQSIRKNLPEFYYYVKNLSFRHLFENSDNGFTQLKTSGGLRLIENNEIVEKIQDYTTSLARNMSLQELNETVGLSYNNKVAKMLDVVTVVEMNESQYVPAKSTTKDHSRYLPPTNPRTLLTTNDEDFNELFNTVFNIINRNKYFKKRLQEIKKSAIELDNLILKEYGSHFK